MLLSSEAQECKHFWKTSKPRHVGIYWIAVAVYSQMSYPLDRVSVFFFLASFCIGKLSHQQHKGG